MLSFLPPCSTVPTIYTYIIGDSQVTRSLEDLRKHGQPSSQEHGGRSRKTAHEPTYNWKALANRDGFANCMPPLILND